MICAHVQGFCVGVCGHDSCFGVCIGRGCVWLTDGLDMQSGHRAAG